MTVTLSATAKSALERLLRKSLGWTPTDQSTPRKARTVQAESATTTASAQPTTG